MPSRSQPNVKLPISTRETTGHLSSYVSCWWYSGQWPRFHDLLNTWLTHYPMAKSGQKTLPAALAQNNHDPSKWTTYDNWKTFATPLPQCPVETLGRDDFKLNYAGVGIEIKQRQRKLWVKLLQKPTWPLCRSDEDTTIEAAHENEPRLAAPSCHGIG